MVVLAHIQTLVGAEILDLHKGEQRGSRIAQLGMGRIAQLGMGTTGMAFPLWA